MCYIISRGIFNFCDVLIISYLSLTNQNGKK
nr:MAG TPA: hypothetical protein [Caudoviricetes sp.]